MNKTLDLSDQCVSDEPPCHQQSATKRRENRTPFRLRIANQSRDDKSLLQVTNLYRGPERRGDNRYEISVGINIQPLDQDLMESGSTFCGITREISRGGLSFISSYPGNFRMATISLQSSDFRHRDLEPGHSGTIVCRVCSTSLIHSNSVEKVYLTNLEFMRQAVR